MFASLLLGIATLVSVDSIPEKPTQPDIIQELFVGRAVFPQEKNELQLTVAPRWLGEELEDAALLPFEVEVGITNRLQIGIESIRRLHNPRNGVFNNEEMQGSAALSVQYSLMRLGASQSTHITFGIEGGVSGNVSKSYSHEIEPYVVLARDVNDWLHLTGSFGYQVSMPTDRGKTLFNIEREEEQTANAAAVFRVKKFRLTSEFTTIFYEGESASAWTPGVIYKPVTQFELGIARPFRLGSEGLPERLILQVMLEI